MSATTVVGPKDKLARAPSEARARRRATAELDKRRLLAVLTAFRKGNFRARLPSDLVGIDAKIADTLNDLIELNQRLAAELRRLSQVVGEQGRIRQRASLGSVTGAWAASVASVNDLVTNLVQPISESARVIGAVARGDLSQTMTLEFDGRPLRGEFLASAKTVNTMVQQLSAFASEVTRVAREVGTEGKLGGQAVVRGAAGTWKDLTDTVNVMAGNLTGQVRNIADVTTAVAKGDLSKKITVDVKGEILELKNTINVMVDQLNSFASEVTRVAREVGTEGKLGGQADVRGVAGVWKDLTENVNLMAGNLTGQVRNIADVTTAVAKGDLSKKITVDVKGEILELKNTINVMVDQLSSFAAEVTRVAREVGTEGKLGGQADVQGAAGVWKALTDNVNLMAGNLTGQVRNIAEVATAVANGDLSKKITVDVRGEILELKNTINVMVDQLNSFASEVTRVAREVGTEGKLGGQADVKDVAGVWKDLTDNVNLMAGNLTGQVRNIADVTTAVAKGDLSKKITVDVRGEILELKNTINVMVDQLNSFASEVTRVAREVGTEGKLGGQADVRGVAGVWKDLTENVNLMAGNLTGQVRNIAEVTTAVALGDLSKKITVDVRGEILELKNTINVMVDQLNSFASEVTRVAREVGTEGKLGGQAQVRGVSGTWKDLTDNVNLMAGNLTGQVRNIAAVTTAVALGDLSKKITVDVKGEILDLKITVNTMVDQLSSFAAEVTRVAREVGTEGKLGGQAQVRGVSGTWKDLTDNVNSMASNLTDQVRGIAKVVTAVATGDLNRKFSIEAKGEIAALADTINGMIGTLAIFADQVTTVAREVGVEGKLGGQASVPGAAGVWKDLTDNVNQLAANLTTQMRAIAEVATAVTTGDLTRSISVEARGEVAALRDNINEMIQHLRDTTQKNSDQDWLKTNLAKFSRMLQGQKDLLTVGRLILSELAPVVSAQHAVFYSLDTGGDEAQLRLVASYAHRERQGVRNSFKLGEGLVGQSALEKDRILLTSVPPEYIQINSGLGEAAPLNVIVLPVIFENQVKAIVELASFERFNTTHQAFLDQLAETIGIVLNTIEANTRTEDLLRQSQSLATELQNQQEELRQTNQQLEEKAGLLAQQNAEVERKNREIEQARQAIEEKASQLALTSKYKSEFLANMSHELRTPLNSLLILSDQLARNPDGNLTGNQMEFAKTIHSSGTDLLTLINDILDLSKIESGTVTIDVGEVRFADLELFVDRTFRHVAEAKSLDFSLEIDPGLPRSIQTDAKRLKQVVKNLLSNAFKFTAQGGVSLRISETREGWSAGHEGLASAGSVIAFEVRDTGIGIPEAKQQIIFEAFQQADGSTSRRYGGTGLGLAISREIANLLGGDIRVQSVAGEGSTFTLYLPATAAARPLRRLATPIAMPSQHAAAEPLALGGIRDDREQIGLEDRVLLVVDNDETFAQLVAEIARDLGWKALVATSGATGLALAREFHPSAITLDLRLPDIGGWRLLELLKADLDTRHIRVMILSTEDEAEVGYERGAWGVMTKPIARRELLEQALDALAQQHERVGREVLLVAGDAAPELAAALAEDQTRVASVDSGDAALALLAERRFDCIVVGDPRGEEGTTPAAIAEAIARHGRSSGHGTPVLLCEPVGGEGGGARPAGLGGPVRRVQGIDQLLDARALALHQEIASLPDATRTAIQRLYEDDESLAGRVALVVDDDVRNIFALTSVLENYDMTVVGAETGKLAIEMLQQTPRIDVVLMDVMMPGLDGYETMRAIRCMPQFRELPIIAVTAKAMKGDREKTFEAGAWDYLAKPVNSDRMLSVLRAWLRG